MATLRLSKFDVAERQLLQAITLFFRNEDPVSIHTLTEASVQVLIDIGKEHGATSFLRESDLIREEHKKEWLHYVNKSRNFFKHADRDPNEIHEFNTIVNDYALLDAVAMYERIKKKWVPETLVFNVWLGIEHPNLLLEGSEYQQMFARAIADGRLPATADKGVMAEMIEKIRSGQLSYPNLCLELGL